MSSLCRRYYLGSWVASSRTELQQILNEAKIFYDANDSQINAKKSKIIMINGNKNDQQNFVTAGPNNEKVYPEPETILGGILRGEGARQSGL